MFKLNTKHLIAGAILAAAVASPSWAATLSFSPVSSNVSVGNSFDVDVLISGLGANEQLATFDLLANFNSSVLSFSSYTLGGGLGNLAAFEAWDLSAGDLGGGVVHFGEVSFLSDLSAQAKAFSLGTLHFVVTGQGNSALTFSNVTLGDTFANNINANLNSASVTAVPEPETLAMFLAGLGLVGLARRRA